VLNRIFGLDRGFALYDDGPPEADEGEGFFHGVADARGGSDAALAWLRRPRGKPFFLWLHLFDVHAPHVAPEGFARRFPTRTTARSRTSTARSRACCARSTRRGSPATRS
jgi:hypothetical protein